MKLERVLLVPDCHIPYHDKKAFALMLKAAKLFRPDIVITLGDFVDFYAVSSHDKDPNRRRNLEWEIEYANAALDSLDKLGAKRKYYVSGNHEDRLERYLMTQAPELFNMVRVNKLLNLKERGWGYVPYKRDVQVGKLYITHDTGNCGPVAHQQALAAYQTNVVIGHTHRIGYNVVGNARGVAHVGAMFGWLGDFDSVDYMHRVRARRDWAHGFGIGYLEPNGAVHLRPIPIVQGAVVIEGHLVR